jgi:uncharacterized membrane protein YgdD (TMEM256/DUF423 family)
MTAKLTLLFAAINGLAAVGFGAFGAHGLKNSISASLLSAFETAVQYHFYHTLALLGVAVLMLQFGQKTSLQISAGLFAVGILLFSGSLYAMALGGPSWLGPITPIGGLAFLAGWIALLVAAVKI